MEYHQQSLEQHLPTHPCTLWLDAARICCITMWCKVTSTRVSLSLQHTCPHTRSITWAYCSAVTLVGYAYAAAVSAKLPEQYSEADLNTCKLSGTPLSSAALLDAVHGDSQFKHACGPGYSLLIGLVKTLCHMLPASCSCASSNRTQQPMHRLRGTWLPSPLSKDPFHHHLSYHEVVLQILYQPLLKAIITPCIAIDKTDEYRKGPFPAPIIPSDCLSPAAATRWQQLATSQILASLLPCVGSLISCAAWHNGPACTKQPPSLPHTTCIHPGSP